MATEIRLPQWAMNLSEGTVIKWLKQEGDPVAVGDALCEVEEMKISDVVESSESGVLLKILVVEDETVPVLTPLCLIGQAGETV